MNTKKAFRALLGVAFVIVVSFFIWTPAHATVCNQDQDLEASWNYTAGTAHIINHSSTCTYNVGLASYKIFVREEPQNQDTQELFSHQETTSTPGSTVNLNITPPSCAYQIDIFQGALLTSFANGVRYNSRIVDGLGQQVFTGGLCQHTPPQIPAPTVQTFCDSNTSKFTVHWSEADRGNDGYNIDISDDNFANHGWYKFVPSGTLTTTGPSGFTSFIGNDGSALSLVEGRAYQVRIFYKASADHSSVVSFTANQCQSQQQLTVTCAVSPSNPHINDSVNWSASASGGTNYTYSWSGTDGLSGTSQSIQHSYGSSGTKNGTVQVTSGNLTATAQCSVNVQDNNQNNDFSVSCYASPTNTTIYNQVSWSASVSGGNGNFTYSWSGDEGLTGASQTVYRSYGYSGTKYGNVIVYSNGQSRSAQCNTYIQNQNYNYNNLSAYCTASPSNPRVGDVVTWNVYPSGGNYNNNNYNYNYNYNYNNNSNFTNGYNFYSNNYNNYSNYYGYYFNWYGTDNLYGSSQTVSKTYYTEGQKQATITVNSNGQNVTQTCSVYVSGNTYLPPYTPPANPSYVYLNQVPYTGAGDTMKVSAFVLTLMAWSAFVAYMVIRKRAIQNGVSVKEQLSTGVSQNIKAFKAQMASKNRNDFLQK